MSRSIVPKSGALLVVSGVLIVAGLVLLVVANQVLLEGVYQGEGLIQEGQDLNIQGEFEQGVGVYTVQIVGFSADTFQVRILDPRDDAITSHYIDREIIEEEFVIESPGTYTMIISSVQDTETQIFAAIGPLPDANKKVLGFLSIYVLIAGMLMLVISAVFEVMRRRSRSV